MSVRKKYGFECQWHLKSNNFNVQTTINTVNTNSKYRVIKLYYIVQTTTNVN